MTASSTPCFHLGMAAWMARRLREEDEQEVRAATGEDPVAVLPRSFDLSTECRLAYLSDSRLPCAIFGVVEHHSSPAVVWMLCTDEVSRAPRAVLKEMSRWAERWAEQYGGIQALAWADNYLHARWCQHLGFVELSHIQHNGHDFIHLYRSPPEDTHV